MVDELSSRRQRFQAGRKIDLADGQSWVFPLPHSPGDTKGFRADPEYRPLVHIVRDADSDAERALAELALAIFLLSWNYDLSPSAYQELLSFPPGSSAHEEWCADLGELVQAHTQAEAAIGDLSTAKSAESATPNWITRLLARFRPSPTDG